MKKVNCPLSCMSAVQEDSVPERVIDRVTAQAGKTPVWRSYKVQQLFSCG